MSDELPPSLSRVQVLLDEGLSYLRIGEDMGGKITAMEGKWEGKGAREMLEEASAELRRYRRENDD